MLDDWTGTVGRALDVPPEKIDVNAVLDLARDVAHGVARPAAPLTAYLVGVAVGQGKDPAEAVAAVRTLIETWPAPGER
jgi:hypothetical protein